MNSVNRFVINIVILGFTFLVSFFVTIQTTLAQSPDSLHFSISAKLTAIQSNLNHKIDSLIQLSNPNKLLLKSLDSLRGKVDSLKNSDLLQDAKNATNKVSVLPNNVTGKLNAIEGKVNQKLNLFSANGDNTPANINLPGAEQLKLPGGDINNSINTQLPNELLSEKIPNANLNLNKNPLAGASHEKLGELTNLDAVKEAKGNIGKVSEVSGEVGQYTSDAKAIVSGDPQAIDQASKNIETKLGGIEEVQQLQKDVAPVQDYTKMIEKWNSDPDYAKELALSKAKDVAVNHFEGHEKELKAVMERMSTVKQKYKHAEVVLDLFKKPTNSMKGKRLSERLLPGMGFQLQAASSHQWYDFNPYVGYRWTGRWTTGLGWIERVASDIKHQQFLHREHGYGPRTYVDFRVKEGLLVKVEAEYFNALVTSPYLMNAAEPNGRAWVWSYFAGLKKTFKFSKYVDGNVQVLYDLYNPMKRSPYMSLLNVRIGFEFPYKRQPKKID